MSGPLGHGSTAGIGSRVGSEAPGALTSFNPRPVSGFPDTRSGIVRVAWTPVRRAPSHRSEMTSQLVLGEVVELLGEPVRDWFAVRGPDGYEGHVTAGALRLVDRGDAKEWTAAADGFSLGTELLFPSPAPLRDGSEAVAERSLAEGSLAERSLAAGSAPWGARLPRAGEETFLLPDGGRVQARQPERILFGPERALAYETDPAAAARTARSWAGAPYVWGGRIREAVDCSGFVQAVYSLHGFRLPRDSRDQLAAGPEPADPAPAHAARPGDLWFFAWDGDPVSHVGVCLGDGAMIHASETRGCVAVDVLEKGEFGRRLATGLVGRNRPRR